MYSLNHIVKRSGISRYMLLKYSKVLEIHPVIQKNGRSNIYYYSAADTDALLNYASGLDTQTNKLNRELKAAKDEILRLCLERDKLRYELKQTLTQLNDALLALKSSSHMRVKDEASDNITVMTVPKTKCDRTGYVDGVALIRKKIGMVE
jgi:hypothetical protein